MKTKKAEWILRLVLIVLTIALTVWVYIEARAIQAEKAAWELENTAGLSAGLIDIAEAGKPQAEESVSSAEPEKLEQAAAVTGQAETPEPEEAHTELDEPEYDEWIYEETEYEELDSETAEPEEADTDGMMYMGTYWVTGYDICVECCGNTEGICASGAVATVGTTVAAGDEFPFGTVLYIEGIGYRTVEDRGGAVGNGVLDVLCSDHAECGAVTGYRDVYVVGG